MSNKKLAHMYDMTIGFKTSDTSSIKVINETTEFLYNMSNTYVNVNDPLYESETFNYNINNYDPSFESNGIPGVLDLNNNRFKLKSILELGDQFEIGDFLEIKIDGQNACGVDLTSVVLAYDTNSKFQNELQVLSTLKTSISQIKKIKKGETIGYGRKGIAKQDTRIAILAIGYADGYDRRFSNGVGKVLINNELAPIIGNICMDMCMAELGNIEAKEGDEVVIFGASPSISELAQSIGTIPYEILTNVGQRVQRVFYSE